MKTIKFCKKCIVGFWDFIMPYLAIILVFIVLCLIYVWAFFETLYDRIYCAITGKTRNPATTIDGIIYYDDDAYMYY